MKPLFRLFAPLLILTIFGLFVSCSEEGISDPIAEGYVEISLNDLQKDFPSGKLVEAELPEQLNLIISLEDHNGAIVWNSEEIKLKKWNESYASKPIQLRIGKYYVTEFLVVDYHYNVLLAAPVVNSPMAYLSDNPLPLDFIVYTGETTAITPEVLDATNKNPEDFGYASFKFDKIKTLDFDLRVFDFNRTTGIYELTDAFLMIESDGDVLFENALGNSLNRITVRDGYENYLIQITKPNRVTLDTLINEQVLKKLLEDKDGPLDLYLFDGLIVWNKLGSAYEVANSEVGPSLNVPGTPNFAPGKFGNGVYPRYASEIPEIPVGVFNEFIPNPLLEPWTIEVWYKPDYSVVDNRIVGTIPYGRAHVIVANCWNWDGANAGIRILSINGGYTGPTDVVADLVYYRVLSDYSFFRNDIIDNDVSWNAGDLVHLAVVYDPAGYDGSPRFELWVNGILHGHSAETEIHEYAEPVVAWPFYVGGHQYRVSQGVVDNLKVFELAKTNFDDRNTE